MTLNITTSWEHDIFAANEGSSHLVVTISASASTRGERAPIDLAFALDRSGSMGGERKLELVKEAVLAAVQQLEPTDRVSLVTYDHEVQVLHRLTPVDTAHRARLARVTRGIEVGGMTNLSGGWLEACRQLSADDTDTTRVRRALLLTDGLANVGITEPRELNMHARELRDRGISTSAIGVGEGFDEILLSGMAESGGGNFQYIAHASELESFFSEELRSLADMVALNPYLDLTMPHGVNAELINAFPAETHRGHTSVDVRDLAAGEQVHLVFAVTSRRAHGESIVPELHLHWTDPRTGSVVEVNEKGAAITIGDARNARRDDATAEKAALEMAARDHREAVKLDREGRFRESRDRFNQSVARLAAAPDTEEIREARVEAHYLYSMDASMAMPEHDRKTTVHAAHRRSRGGRRPQGDPR